MLIRYSGILFVGILGVSIRMINTLLFIIILMRVLPLLSAFKKPKEKRLITPTSENFALEDLIHFLLFLVRVILGG